MNLNECLDFLLDLSYEAGEILLKFQKKRHELKITDKGVEGIATEADHACDEFLITQIKSKYPDIFILSEESSSDEASYEKAIENDYCWVIDPLDGTNNFLNGIPIYAIALSLVQKGKPVLGVVYNPTSGECFFAQKDKGAFLIDFRINPFKRYDLKVQGNSKKMSECIFSPAPSYGGDTSFDQKLSVFKKNIWGCRAVRRLGSAALELCYVANGNFDGYWEKHLKPWDMAAAGVICQEAGISLTDFDGQEFSPFNKSVLAAAAPLHEKILGKLSS